MDASNISGVSCLCPPVPFPKVQSRRLLAELLLQTSQLRPKDQVVIIAATNRMGELPRDINASPALLALLASPAMNHTINRKSYIRSQGVLVPVLKL